MLSADRVELREGKALHRCRACNVWFVIRWDDAVALGVAQPLTPSPHVATS